MTPNAKKVYLAGACEIIPVTLFLATLVCRAMPTMAESRTSVEPSNRVNIAVLLPEVKSRRFSIQRVYPAISLALDTVKERNLLEGSTMVVSYADSKCDISEAINAAFNLYLQRRVHVFLGPCCDYAAAPVARQIRYWNLPMITAGAMAGDFGTAKKSHYPLLTRVGPDFNSLANFLLNVLHYYGFKRVKLIYNPLGQDDIMERFCHLAADHLHRTMLKPENNITQDYYKFLRVANMKMKLTTEIGNTYSSKSNFCLTSCLTTSVYQLLHCWFCVVHAVRDLTCYPKHHRRRDQ